jgi:hypothetical protein
MPPALPNLPVVRNKAAPLRPGVSAGLCLGPARRTPGQQAQQAPRSVSSVRLEPHGPSPRPGASERGAPVSSAANAVAA